MQQQDVGRGMMEAESTKGGEERESRRWKHGELHTYTPMKKPQNNRAEDREGKGSGQKPCLGPAPRPQPQDSHKREEEEHQHNDSRPKARQYRKKGKRESDSRDNAGERHRGKSTEDMQERAQNSELCHTAAGGRNVRWGAIRQLRWSRGDNSRRGSSADGEENGGPCGGYGSRGGHTERLLLK